MVEKSNDKLVENQCVSSISDKLPGFHQLPLPFSSNCEMTRDASFKLTSEDLDLFAHENSLFKDQSFKLSSADLEKCIPASLKRLNRNRISEDQKRRMVFGIVAEKSKIIRNRYLENCKRKQAYTYVTNVRSRIARSSLTKNRSERLTNNIKEKYQVLRISQ